MNVKFCSYDLMHIKNQVNLISFKGNEILFSRQVYVFDETHNEICFHNMPHCNHEP
jgi:hypothetical protein